MKTTLMLAVFAVATGAVAAVTWDDGAIASPKSWPVEDTAISNDYGRIEGVLPVWIEGEPYLGRSTRIFAWWGLPGSATGERKVPAMVLVHGGGGTAFARWVKTWNDRGYAAIAMDMCGGAPRGERDGQPHPRHDWSGPYGWQDSRGYDRGSLRDEWTYQAVSAVMRCHSFLSARPEVDAAHVGLTGISWGGYLTSIVMGVDGRFAFAAPVYGCGWYDMNPEWDRIFGNANWNVTKETGELARLDYGRWLRDWDARNYIGGAKCPVLRCNGTRDFFYTAEMTERSSAALPTGTVSMLSIKNPMPHGHGPAGDPKEIAAWADYFLKGGAKPLEIASATFGDATFVVRFSENGDRAVAAQLLFTADWNESNKDRQWRTQDAAADDLADGEVSFEVPDWAKLFFVNIRTAKGEVYSTRLFSNASEGCPVDVQTKAGLAGRRDHENTEWQIAYAHHLTDGRKDMPRVLLVGDSIVKAYQWAVAKRLGDSVNLSFWASSYCVTSPAYLKFLDAYLCEAKYDVIHFNNTLHTPEGLSVETWKRELRKAFELIRRRQPQAKLIWASGTPLKSAERNVWVRTLNAAAKEVADSFGDIAINDLYAFEDPYDRETYWSDMHHHKGPLVEAEARQVVRAVLAALGHEFVCGSSKAGTVTVNFDK